jgi:hypothetical protein
MNVKERGGGRRHVLKSIGGREYGHANGERDLVWEGMKDEGMRDEGMNPYTTMGDGR